MLYRRWPISRIVRGALIAAVIACASCNRVADIRSEKLEAEAREALRDEDYKHAADLFEQLIREQPDRFPKAYFGLAAAYGNLYQADVKGDADNDRWLTKAIENHEIAAGKLSQSPQPEDKRLARQSLEYLQGVYADNLQDREKAASVIEQVISMDPSDFYGYFLLVRFYEDSGDYD